MEGGGGVTGGNGTRVGKGGGVSKDEEGVWAGPRLSMLHMVIVTRTTTRPSLFLFYYY